MVLTVLSSTKRHLLPISLFMKNGYFLFAIALIVCSPVWAQTQEPNIRFGPRQTIVNQSSDPRSDEAAESAALAYPMPFANELNLRTEADLANVQVRLIHGYGQVYEVSPIISTQDGLRINVASLLKGPYIIRLQQPDQVQTFRGSKG